MIGALVLAGRALVSRIPGITWVILLAIALLGVGVCAIWFGGKHAGKFEVHKAALGDSAAVAHVKVAEATKRSDGQLHLANNWRMRTLGARERFEAQRRAVLAQLDSTPPAIVALVDSARTIIAEQETAIQVHVGATAALLSERGARIQADTVEAHQIAIATDGGSSLARSAIAIVVGAGSGAAVGALVAGPVGAAVGGAVGATLAFLVGR